MSCHYNLNGTVEAGGKGTISSTSGNGCKGIGACQSQTGSWATTGLPWQTALIESEGVIRESFTGTSGTPGWTFECQILMGRYTDTCYLTVNPELVNGLEGNVFMRFGEGLPKTTCSLGGANAGEWRGELTLTPASGAIKAKK